MSPYLLISITLSLPTPTSLNLLLLLLLVIPISHFTYLLLSLLSLGIQELGHLSYSWWIWANSVIPYYPLIIDLCYFQTLLPKIKPARDIFESDPDSFSFDESSPAYSDSSYYHHPTDNSYDFNSKTVSFSLNYFKYKHFFHSWSLSYTMSPDLLFLAPNNRNIIYKGSFDFHPYLLDKSNTLYWIYKDYINL